MLSTHHIAERLCIHQVTLMQCDFRESVECLSRNGVYKTAVWHEKLGAVGVDEACRILDGEGVRATSLCFGGLLNEEAVKTRNRQRIDEAAALGVDSLVIISGGLPSGSRDLIAARENVINKLGLLIDHARHCGVRLALEPLHPMVCGNRSVLSTLAEANDVLDALDAEDVCAIALDSYAVWWEAKLLEEIARAGSRISNFHVSDWLANTADIRLDRGMPGDGLIDNEQIFNSLCDTGYSGDVEVEIFSARNWWKKPADQVVQTIIERLCNNSENDQQKKSLGGVPC